MKPFSKDIYDHNFISIDGNYIHKSVVMGENVKLGKNNVIMPFAVIGQPGFIREMDKLSGIIEIGDNNWIGSYAVIMAGREGITSIGHDNMVMNYVNVGHNVKIGNNNEIGAKSILCGFAKLGDLNKIKVCVCIRNRISIGDNNLIGMGSVIVKSILNNKKVYGNPAKIINI